MAKSTDQLIREMTIIPQDIIAARWRFELVVQRSHVTKVFGTMTTIYSFLESTPDFS